MNETDDNRGRYSISWKIGGNESVELLHYALPHHQVKFRRPHYNSKLITRFISGGSRCRCYFGFAAAV